MKPGSGHPSADPGCAACRGDGYLVSAVGEHAHAAACACVGRCPMCRGTGFVAVSDAFRAPRRRCECQRLAGRIRRFDQVGIPARHAASTRVSFDPSGARMGGFLAVESYLKSWEVGGNNRGLVLHGGVGRGKTHLLCALLRELVFRHGVSARFVEFSHLLADLKSGFDAGRGASSLIDPLVDVDVLGIDELGKGRNTEFEGTVVDELVSRRYNALRPIVATTNYPPVPSRSRAEPNLAQPGPEHIPALVDRIGARVFSRLEETSDFVGVAGPDYRGELRAARRR